LNEWPSPLRNASNWPAILGPGVHKLSLHNYCSMVTFDTVMGRCSVLEIAFSIQTLFMQPFSNLVEHYQNAHLVHTHSDIAK
jgi:hypothetical protein